jgi:two-component system cell cycle response regulator CpdR
MAHRILVVDDDIHTRDVLSLHLQRHGFEVVALATGADALDRLQQEPFDLLISDILMKPVDGLEVIAKVCNGSQPIPIIAMTGGDVTLIDEAQARGAKVVVSKPFSLQEIVEESSRLISEYSVAAM